MIPDYFILIVGGVFLLLAAFEFYILFRIKRLDEDVIRISKMILLLGKKPEGDNKNAA